MLTLLWLHLLWLYLLWLYLLWLYVPWLYSSPRYTAPVVVSSVTPPLGPLAGGKLVIVRGANFDGGSALRVAFGELQPVA